MADVIPLRAAMAAMLARELNVSVAFVEQCAAGGIAPRAALDLIAWFEGLAEKDRTVVKRAAERRRTR